MANDIEKKPENQMPINKRPEILVRKRITVILGNDNGNHAGLAVQTGTKWEIIQAFTSHYPNHIIYTIMTDQTPLGLVNTLQKDRPLIDNIKGSDSHVNFIIKNNTKDANIRDVLIRLQQEQMHGYFYSGSGEVPKETITRTNYLLGNQ